MRIARALLGAQRASMTTLPRYSLVPGPTRIAASTLDIYGRAGFDASPDLEEGFFSDYAECQIRLKHALNCANDDSVAIMSGEAMVALWGAVKSVIVPGDQVVCVSNGIFGDGFAEMAKSVGAKVSLLSSPYDEPIDMKRVTQELEEKRPTLVTAVHCDTPSGTINRNLAAIGQACQKVNALFLVDFVASAFATPVHVAEWGIDLGLLGSQKVLSLPPDLAILTVTPRAWKRVEEVSYRGYDAVLPFKTALERRYMPYSHNWRAVCALKHALQKIDLEESFARHEQVASLTRQRISEMGLSLFPPTSLSAPTVTAVHVPPGWQWKDLDKELRRQEVVFGGSYGSLKEKVFRIGHMGTQADQEMVLGALNILEDVLKQREKK